jgi:hypothetical protein
MEGCDLTNLAPVSSVPIGDDTTPPEASFLNGFFVPTYVRLANIGALLSLHPRRIYIGTSFCLSLV